MWKNKDTHIYDIYKNHSHDDLLKQTTTDSSTVQTYKSQHLYPGSDFDVFGNKEETPEEEHQEIIAIEPSLPLIKNQPTNILNKPSITSTQSLMRKRKHVEIEQKPIDHFFLEKTASINTPIASMFIEDSDKNKDNGVSDMAYF